MPIRTQRTLPKPIHVDLPLEWVVDLKSSQPSSVRIEEATIAELGKAVTALTNALRIAKDTAADVTSVQEHIKKIERQSKKILNAKCERTAIEWRAKLKASLSSPRDASEQVAAEQISECFRTVEEMRTGSPLTVHAQVAGPAYLEQIQWDAANLQRLVKYAGQAYEFVGLSNSELRERVSPLIGWLCIDGKPFQFCPDPWRKSHVRPEVLELDKHAKHLVALYEWMGGIATFHKNGSGEFAPPPTPFMRFIALMRDAVPQPYRPRGDRLLKRAMVHLEAERRAA